MRRVLRFLPTLCLTLLTTFPASAQRPGGGGVLDDGGQRPRRMQRGIRGDRPDGPPGGAGFFEGQFARMARRLDLDEAQQTQFEQILAPYRESMRSRFELMQQMREAERNNDTVAMENLRGQMEEMGRPQDSFEEISAELEPILRPEQIDKLDAWREEFSTRQTQREQFRQATTELPEKLNLDPAQTEQFEEAVIAVRESMRRRIEGVRQAAEEDRAAEEAGEQPAGERVREQTAMSRIDRSDLLNELLTKVEGIVTEEQKPALAAYRAELASAVEQAAGRGKTPDLRTMFRTARRLDLDDEQKAELRDLEREGMRASRAAGKAEEANVAQEYRTKLMSILTAEQKAAFEQSLNTPRQRGQRQQRPVSRGAETPGR